MLPVLLIVVLLVVVGLVVASRTVAAKSRQWERTFVEEDRWKLVNRTGAPATGVTVEVRGRRIRLVDGGEVGDVAADGDIDLRTAVDLDATEGGAPMVVVRWTAPGADKPRFWTAPLPAPEATDA